MSEYNINIELSLSMTIESFVATDYSLSVRALVSNLFFKLTMDYCKIQFEFMLRKNTSKSMLN